MAKEGLIVRALSGFYYVKTGEGQEVECRARGLFRKQEISPCVGDRVELEETGEGKGQVVAILPRKNSLVRPPVANLDLLVLVVSSCEPLPNLLVLDKLLAIAECQNIPPAIVLTKSDLEDPSPVADIYRKVGYPVFVVSSETGEGVEEVRAFLPQRASRFKMKLIVKRRSEVAFAEAFLPAMETGKGIISLSPGATSGNVISP